MPSPYTICITPSGKSASSKSLMMNWLVNEHSSEPLATTVLPARSACVMAIKKVEVGKKITGITDFFDEFRNLVENPAAFLKEEGYHQRDEEELDAHIP